MDKGTVSDKYQEGNLKEYKHWILAISFRQHSLGSMVIIAKRKVERISKLKDNELLELRFVMQVLETLLMKAKGFKPNRFNYLQLGNDTHQLHIHCIPRYSTSRNFAGKKWVDENYGHRPIFLTKDQESDVETVKVIRDYLKPLLAIK